MSPHTILVIDDQEDLREILQMKLTAAGYNVVTAANGYEALKALAREKFDLVLTDLIMPERDGLDVVLGVRQTQPGLPVIVMSGGGRMTPGQYLKMASAFGATAVLEKPIPDEKLLAAVALALSPKPAA